MYNTPNHAVDLLCQINNSTNLAVTLNFTSAKIRKVFQLIDYLINDLII